MGHLSTPNFRVMIDAHPRPFPKAEDELRRRLAYQPIGRFWAFPIARSIARGLVETRVRPNALTLAAGALMLGAAALVAFDPVAAMPVRLSVAFTLAAALVLDTADGHLARWQGTASPFGRWLDHVLDELADVALHSSIAWAGFMASGKPIWLGFGILYASGKYMFQVQSVAGEIFDRAKLEEAGRTGETSPGDPGGSPLRGVVRGLGHADFRWHLWIVLAAAGRLDLALVFYSIYFPVRTGMSCLARGVKHVHS